MDALLTYWPIWSFFFAVVLIPGIGWAIRLGLASKADLAEEAGARAKDIEDLEMRLDGRLAGITKTQTELSDRTLRMEAEISHMPSKDDILELKTSAVRTEEQISAMTREFSSISAAVTRIENHFIKGRSA